MKISTKLSVAAGVAIGALAAGSLAWAAAPDSGTAIHGCVNAKGSLRVGRPHAKALKCGKKETLLTWSRQGPAGIPGTVGAQGPAGSRGATGATGAAGAQGPAGLTGVHEVDVQSPSFTSGFHLVSAKCPTGEDVFGVGSLIYTQWAGGSGIGSAATTTEFTSQTNRVTSYGSSAAGSGLVGVDIDPAKLAAGTSIAVIVHVTCAKTA